MTATVAAVVLAAGRSTRAGGINKLLAELDGKPLVAHGVEAALASAADPVIVVTGHDGDRMCRTLAGLPLHVVDNRRYADGMASSLAAGIAAVPATAAGVVVLLGDMPWVRAGHIDALIMAFRRSGGAAICVPVHAGRRGNPVLWPRRRFGALAGLSGDRGGRDLLACHADAIVAVAMADDGVLRDVDTVTDLAAVTCRPA